MANYSDQEVQDAVSKVVQSTVRNPTGILGQRQVEISFSDTQQAAAGVYILYFNAPYYTLLLGITRIQDSLSTQVSTINALIDAVIAAKRAVTPINDLSPLANAKAALDELQAAVGNRTTGFSDITTVPAFRRYSTNLSQFIATAGPNVKSTSSTAQGGSASSDVPSIVDTPAGAQQRIPALVRQMKDQQDDLVRRITLLNGALADFAALKLPQLAAQGVISNASSVLAQHYTSLSALSPMDRLTSLRSVMLDVLTQLPLVESYGAGVSPSQYIGTRGVARAYSSVFTPASPASIDSDTAGPYTILASDHFIRVTVDGGTPLDYPLPLSTVAELDGQLTEPYALTLNTSDRLKISFDDPNAVSPLTREVVLPNGTVTALSIVNAINAGMAGTDLVAERYFLPLKYDGLMAIALLTGLNVRFSVIAGGLGTGLNIKVGDLVDVLEGANAGKGYTITAIDPAGLYVDALGDAVSVAVATPGVEVQIGSPARAIRLRDGNPAVGIPMRRTLQLVGTQGPEDLTAALIGFAAGISARNRPTLASEVVANITGSISQFTASLDDLQYNSGAGHTSLIDPSVFVLSKLIVAGAVTGGTDVVLTLGTLYTPGLFDPLDLGDVAVLRETINSADVNREGVVTAVDTTLGTISVHFPVGVIASSDVTMEFGPNVPWRFGDVLQITDGPNQGRYTAREDQNIGTTCSIEFLCDRALPIPKTGSTTIGGSYTLSKSFVTFSSVLKQTTSSIVVDNSPVQSGHAAGLFFGALPATAGSQTTYLQFDTYPTSTAVGDIVEFYEDQYNLISRNFEVKGVLPNSRVIQLSAPVPSGFSISFDSGVPNPFARIRIAQTANYEVLKGSTDIWLLNTALTTNFYRDLVRFLNPVVSNANPTSAAVDDAVNQLRRLAGIMSIAGAAQASLPTANSLEAILNTYESPIEPAVDVLLATLRNKGSDRAIDLLLEGQFSTFFGLDLHTVSYSGAMTAAARDAAMNDLPVRKINRRDVQGQKLIGTIPNQTDYEYDTSDADSVGLPDPGTVPEVVNTGDQ